MVRMQAFATVAIQTRGTMPTTDSEYYPPMTDAATRLREAIEGVPDDAIVEVSWYVSPTDKDRVAGYSGHWEGHKDIAVADLRALLTDRDDAYAMADAIEVKMEALLASENWPHSRRTCACSVDESDDVCAVHSPQLKAALAERDRLRELISGALRISSLWLPGDDVQPEHEDEARTLGLMHEAFVAALAPPVGTGELSIERAREAVAPPEEPTDLRAERDRLREALVACALPYEALLMDRPSREWIAPGVWATMEKAVIAARAVLAPPEEL